MPLLIWLSVQLAAAVIGIADPALLLHIERTAVRREVYTRSSKAKSVGSQMRVAEAAVELKTARLLIQAAAERCDQVGVTGEPMNTETRAELKWNASYAVELSRRATERFFAISAANAIYNDSRLQGRYRDVNTACPTPSPTSTAQPKCEAPYCSVSTQARRCFSRQGFSWLCRSGWR